MCLNSRAAVASVPTVRVFHEIFWPTSRAPNRTARFWARFFVTMYAGAAADLVFSYSCSAFQLSLSESQLGTKHILKKIMSLNKKLMIDGDL